MNDLPALRKYLKRARLAVPERTRRAAAAATADRILKMPRFVRAKRIAGYYGSGGELDPMPLVRRAAMLGKQCYLPVLHPFRHGHLLFCRWQPGDIMLPNRFNIPEPPVRTGGLIATRDLELVVVPLLGFDSDCNRIGMGGGFYDRSFAFVHRLKHIKPPFLLGVAHESQHVDQLSPQPWDIPLDAVVTHECVYHRKTKR